MSKIRKEMQELVEAHGDRVAIGEPPCVLWKAEHENCSDCLYELGCGKVARLMLVMLIPITYSPTSFADHQTMTNRIQELMAMTMEAKTPDELQLIPHC